MSGPIPHPQWEVVPAGARLGLRIDMQTVGVPVRKPPMALMAVGNTWGLTSGSYLLKVRLQFDHVESGPDNQWVGQIAMPPLEVVVTAQMLADGAVPG